MEAEGVCPPNLEQGTSEEAARRFGGRRARVREKGSSAVGVVSSPVIGPDGVVCVGATRGILLRARCLTGAVEWKLSRMGRSQPSAAIDSDGQLCFATDAGTIYQVVESVPPPAGQVSVCERAAPLGSTNHDS